MVAVDQAIPILNHLPPASRLDPTSYPPESRPVNYQAQPANLHNLKSRALAALLEQLGLTQPTRFAFNVHDFAFSNGTLVAQTVMRNFDPLDFSITNRVNDSAYGSYLVLFTNDQSGSVTAEQYLIDPLAAWQPAVAEGALAAGEFFTGLTRADVGGLRHLLRTNNSNLEILLPGVHGVGPNAGDYVNQTVRRGVDKITFVRRDYDSIVGQLVAPCTNQFTDYYLSDNTVVPQELERVITEPDILFTAGNGDHANVPTPQVFRTGTSN